MRRSQRRAACRNRIRSRRRRLFPVLRQFLLQRRRGRTRPCIAQTLRASTLKSDAIDSEASPLGAGRRLQIRMIIDELDVEQGDALDRIGRRGCVRRASADGEGSEDQDRRNSQHGKESVAEWKQNLAPAKPPTTPGSPFGVAIPHRLILSERAFSVLKRRYPVLASAAPRRIASIRAVALARLIRSPRSPIWRRRRARDADRGGSPLVS